MHLSKLVCYYSIDKCMSCVHMFGPHFVNSAPMNIKVYVFIFF